MDTTRPPSFIFTPSFRKHQLDFSDRESIISETAPPQNESEDISDTTMFLRHSYLSYTIRRDCLISMLKFNPYLRKQYAHLIPSHIWAAIDVPPPVIKNRLKTPNSKSSGTPSSPDYSTTIDDSTSKASPISQLFPSPITVPGSLSTPDKHSSQALQNRKRYTHDELDLLLQDWELPSFPQDVLSDPIFNYQIESRPWKRPRHLISCISDNMIVSTDPVIAEKPVLTLRNPPLQEELAQIRSIIISQHRQHISSKTLPEAQPPTPSSEKKVRTTFEVPTPRIKNKRKSFVGKNTISSPQVPSFKIKFLRTKENGVFVLPPSDYKSNQIDCTGWDKSPIAINDFRTGLRQRLKLLKLCERYEIIKEKVAKLRCEVKKE
jgi:hypothetical protein